MRITAIATIFSALVVWGVTEGQVMCPAPRDNVYRITLSDGATLTIDHRMYSRIDRGKSEVRIKLWAKDGDGQREPEWTTDFTSVDYAPEVDHYYALVNTTKDRIFVFATWNSHYCVIERRTGRVVTAGDGDDVLRGYASLTPLRLTTLFIDRSRWESYNSREADEEDARAFLQMDAIAVFCTQPIPKSKLSNCYVIQFDPHWDANGQPPKEWHPLFVVAWKAQRQTVQLARNRAIAVISINGHSIAPPAGTSCIYALQPDYSLRQISLTKQELADLFSCITRQESRASTREARRTFPTSAEWDRAVNACLKVVEPERVNPNPAGWH
jgi:hypothetical protein